MSTDIEIGQEKNSKLSCVFSSLFVMAFAAEVDVSLFRMEKKTEYTKNTCIHFDKSLFESK